MFNNQLRDTFHAGGPAASPMKRLRTGPEPEECSSPVERLRMGPDECASPVERLRMDPDECACSRKRLRTGPDECKEVMRFAKLTENATAPTKGSARSAGYDLYSAYDYSIPPMGKVVVKTDIQIAIPSGCYGRMAPRSGLADKYFIDVGAGVVDEDYRGNVRVVLFNFGKETFEVKKGDRIAQLICEKICHPELEEHKTLDETVRGAGGFGSTGKN